jgi:amino acid adenylation domain-containing protein
MNTSQNLIRSRSLFPDKPAIIFEDEPISYFDLDEASNRAANILSKLGIKRSHRVALILPNIPAFIIAYFGVQKIGAISVSINSGLRKDEIKFILADSDASTVITTESLRSNLPLTEELPGLRHVLIAEGKTTGDDLSLSELMDKASSQIDVVDMASCDPSSILYTSGTTGAPKGVTLSHDNLLSNIGMCTYTLRLCPDDRLLLCLPLFHAFALGAIMHPSIHAGAALVLHRDSDPGKIARSIAHHKVTLFFGVPAIYNLLYDKLDSKDADSLRTIISGAASLPGEISRKWHAKFGLVINEMYGLSETTLLSHNHFLKYKPGSVGTPLDGIHMKVVDDNGCDLPQNEVGEIVVSGPNVMLGYWKNPKETAEVIRDGWFYTGDIGWMDEDGYFFITDRSKDMINIGGQKAYPSEIENVLLQHKAVADAAVYGVPDEVLGEEVRASVVLKHGEAATEDEIREFCRLHIADYKVPYVEITDSVPKSITGKILRRMLREKFASGAENKNGSLVTQLAAASTADRESLLRDFLRVEIKRLTGTTPGDKTSLFDLGMTSLISIRLANRITTALEYPIAGTLSIEHPTVESLTSFLSEKLSVLLQSQGPADKRADEIPASFKDTIQTISPVRRDQDIRLSFSQQRLWFLDRLEDGAAATYNEPLSFRIRGGLDTEAVKKAINKIIDRHEALRTVFKERPSGPVQVIVPELKIEIPVIDLEPLPSDSRESEIRRHAIEAARRPFNLSRGPLIRASLLAVGGEDNVLLITIHHIVTDGWSAKIFMHEFAALYKAIKNGAPSPLSGLKIQYADYAMWQRQQLTKDKLDTQLSYWKKQLHNAPTITELPTDYKRPALQTYGGHTVTFRIDHPVTARLKDLCRRYDVTLFMSLQAAFAVLLHRYTGQDDIMMGTPVANRNHEDIEPLIGFFVNTLVLRTGLSGNPKFTELLAQTKRTTINAYGNEDIPFDRLIEELGPERSLSYHPLIQVMFDMIPFTFDDFRLPGADMTRLEVGHNVSKFDLTVLLEETATGLKVYLEYNKALFSPETISRMTNHFKTLVEGIVEDPHKRISELPILTQSEREEILIAFNDTATDYPRDKTITRLFEEQVENTPDNVAIVFFGQRTEHPDGLADSGYIDNPDTLTYKALNARANQLARYLQTLGVGPQVMVGMNVERSAWMIIGLLGILKAGGVYVGIDPDYPSERIGLMVEDTGMKVLITEERFVSTLPEINAHILAIDRNSDIFEDGSGNRIHTKNVKNTATADNLAYISYTSGSTGTPKGVCIPHRGVVRLVKRTNYIEFCKNDVWLQFAPLPFDGSTLEIWGCLLNGGKLIIMPPHTPSLEELGAVISKHKVTTMFLTTGLFNLMADSQLDSLRSVRKLITGGDAISVSHAKKVLRALPECTLLNAYGPTENTALTTYYEMNNDTPIDGSIPIGRPISNTEVYILDHYCQPCPIGVFGEIYTGGAGLAAGYHKRPELTDSAFIPHPFSNRAGARLYKTGDMARFRPCGNIEFLGRRDFQVKLRGFRVELGEIEATLKKHPAIRDSVVIAGKNDSGDKQIVAYILPRLPENADESGLRDYLKERLPGYMVPSLFVTMEAFPLNSNGKIDLKALPGPERSAVQGLYATPSNPGEETMASLWATVLNVSRIGIHDNFFDLGGHSLLATQIVSRVREAFGVEIPVRRVFEHPTIAELTGCVSSRGHEMNRPVMPPVKPVSRDKDPRLSFSQQRLWFLDKFEDKRATYNIPLALRVCGGLDIDAAERALNEIIRRHEVLRTVFKGQNDDASDTELTGDTSLPSQHIMETHAVRISQVAFDTLPECKEEREAEMRRLATEEWERPFDLSSGPLIRVRILEAGDGEHVLLITMHHIITDGWSMEIFWKEFTVFYEAFSEGAVATLPPLDIQYADFAEWQRQWLSDDTIEDQLSYWKDALRGAPALANLPTDLPRPAIQTFRGETVSFNIDKDMTDRLRKFSSRHGVTLFMTLEAAFGTLLYRYRNTDDILIGSPIASRNHKDIESLIGFFVNTLVLRHDMSSNPPFIELLDCVKQTTLDAYAHQDIPFERLVEELRPERSLSHHPLFQVLFELHAVSLEDFAIPGLSVEPYETDYRVSKFDLTLSIEEICTGLSASFEYNTDLFLPGTIKKMAERYKILLDAILTNPERKISELSFMTDEERRHILEISNSFKPGGKIEKNLTSYEPVHEIFVRQAEKTPTGTAIFFKEDQLTYGALDSLSNKLAHYLGTIGVETGTHVGICLDRSPEAIICILGVQKSGGVCVLLEPEPKAERLRFMLEDADVEILFSDKHSASELSLNRLQVISRARCKEIFDGKNEGRLGCRPDIRKERPAYIIYTSGSTGRPKGVMVSHGALSGHIQNIVRYYNTGENDRVLQFSSICFDTALEQIFSALITGAALVLRDGIWSPGDFFSAVKKHKISVADIPPAYLHELLESWPGRKEMPEEAEVTARPFLDNQLRLIIVGGEKISPETLRLWKRIDSGNTKLFNAYGPTEATITATLFELTDYDVDGGNINRPDEDAAPSGPLSSATGNIPIGRPLYGRSAYILDNHGALVPAGVPGELCIGGMWLSDGYRGNGVLTDKKFTPDPFGNRSGARLYKTGDLARWTVNADNEADIEFLGRIDHQAKIRGFRIEPGEIEALLAVHPRIKTSVVIADDHKTYGPCLTAYIVLKDAPGPEKKSPAQNSNHQENEIREFRDYLKERLPNYMVPSFFIFLTEMPVTPGGKIDRKALPLPGEAYKKPHDTLPHNEIEARLSGIYQEVLNVEKVSIYDNFFDMGGHSLLLMRLQRRLEDVLKIDISIVNLFQYPSIASLAGYIAGDALKKTAPETPADKNKHKQIQGDNKRIAIIGMVLRFPGAENPDEFWENLTLGKESVTFLSDEELSASGVDRETFTDPNYIKAGAFLRDIDLFDAPFFGYTPREAETTDPQQRLFLECAHELLETAAYNPEKFGGRIGVYAGSAMSSYLINNLLPNMALTGITEDIDMGNDKDFIPSRVSYKLNLTGPSMNINTACSTALVAVHMACMSLRDNQCDMAMAGGVSIRLPRAGYLYRPNGIMSPDGHCRAFDARACGAVGGDGVGIVLLKRLDDALRDRDMIHAVIRGSHVNNDGAQKVAYTAPGVTGQAEAIRGALFDADVHPGSITYIEAHGTGTVLGDPIEIEAITQAFRKGIDGMSTKEKGYCALGSVKTNVGHLNTAAGIAGLIKTVLSLKHGKLPPSLHYDAQNPKINFSESPFFVNNRLSRWRRGESPRRAGVSSFGIGGTNAHVILEEAPGPIETDNKGSAAPWQLFILSAKTQAALERATENLTAFLEKTTESTGDIAYTLQTGRRAFKHRRIIVCNSKTSALAALKDNDSKAVYTGAIDEKKKSRTLSISERKTALNTGNTEAEPQPLAMETMETSAENNENDSDMKRRITALGRQWLGGVDVNWDDLYNGKKHRRIALPTYPLDKKRYWIEPPEKVRKKKPSNYYRPVWTQAPLTPEIDMDHGLSTHKDPETLPAEQETWLIFSDGSDISRKLIKGLTEKGRKTITVYIGDRYVRINNNRAAAGTNSKATGLPGSYRINPASAKDYDKLFESLHHLGHRPRHIVYTWMVTKCHVSWTDLGFHSLMFLAQAFGRQGISTDLDISIISDRMQRVAGETELFPEKAVLLGPALVIPKEYPNIKCRSIDIDCALPDARLGDLLLEELTHPVSELQTAAEAAPESEPGSRIIAFREDKRYLRGFEPVAPNEGIQRLRQEGVYLITGGLGGIGLVLAEYLAKTVSARLVLVGRSPFPERKKWNHYLRINGIDLTNDTTGEKILKLREIETLGSEVMVACADIANRDEMKTVIEEAENRFGAINGIIHAAGVPGGGVIQLKTREVADSVLLPKIKGVQVLDDLLGDADLDFMMLCSSLTGIFGEFGQADYTAANAYLDAYANAKTVDGMPGIMSISWDTWAEVGMAVGASKRIRSLLEGEAQKPGKETVVKTLFNHPLFDGSIPEETTGAHRRIYISTLDPSRDWVLDEHRIMGQPTLPATVYLEMARAAYTDYKGLDGKKFQPVELRDVSILTPLIVEDGSKREIRTTLKDAGENTEFSITSRKRDDVWEEHARGVISTISRPVSTQSHDIQALRDACIDGHGAGNLPDMNGALIAGPRFRNLKAVEIGKRRGFAHIALPDEFMSDLELFPLHPALLDVAISFLSYDRHTDGVPIGFKRVRVLSSPLPQTIYSASRFLEHEKSKAVKNSTTKYNVTLMDETGEELVSIEEFTLLQVDIGQITRAGDTPLLPGGSPETDSKNQDAAQNEEIQAGPVDSLLKDGIRSVDGAEMFRSILGGRQPHVLVAATGDLDGRLKGVFPELEGRRHEDENRITVYDRPGLDTPFTAPGTETETMIARIWGVLLGIKEVGIHDSFFDLGGHSLLGAQIIARIKEACGVTLPLAVLFETPTVSEIARDVDIRGKETTVRLPARASGENPLIESSLIPIKPDGTKRPFFCIPGIGGNTSQLYKLSGALDSDRPFYGLQAVGLDGVHAPQGSIEEMAGHYIECIKTIQDSGPYLLGGHSLGGKVAFEMARQLHRAGEATGLVINIDSAAPPYIDATISDDAQIVCEVAGIYEFFSGKKLNITDSDIRDLGFDEKLVYLKKCLEDASLVSPGSSIKEIKGLINVFKANNRFHYAPERESIPVRIALFRAKEPLPDNISLAETRKGGSWGWDQFTKAPVDVYDVPGNHFTMLGKPHVRTLGGCIRECIEKIEVTDDF